MEKVKVKQVWEKPDGSLAPLLIDFEHADVVVRDPNIRDLSSYFQTKVYSNTRSSSYLSAFEDAAETPTAQKKLNTRQVVMLGNDHMAYVGSTDSDLNKSTASDGMRSFLALRRGGKVRIIEVTPMKVSPHVKGHSYVEDSHEEKAKMSAAERRAAETELVKAFGSKKKRLAFESKEKNKVVDMNETIRIASEQAKMTDIPDSMEDTSYLEYIPPCNREAALVSEVYSVSDLLYDYELEALDEPASKYLKASAEELERLRKEEVFSEFFHGIIKYLKVGRGDSASIHSMTLVLYAEILIRVYKLPYKEIRKRHIEFPSAFPAEVAKRVLDDFTIVNALGVRTRSEEMKDKACCHAMVAALLACDYTVDLSLMSSIFHMHIDRLTILARAVGMNVKKKNGTIGVLSIPLAKPIQLSSRKATKRR